MYNINLNISIFLLRTSIQNTDRIRPNYRTVRLGFSKIIRKTCGKIYIYLLRIHFKKDK